MSLEKIVDCAHSFEKHINHFLMISSEVSIVITTYTSYLEVAYLQKIVLYCSTFLYHNLSCEI